MQKRPILAILIALGIFFQILCINPSYAQAAQPSQPVEWQLFDDGDPNFYIPTALKDKYFADPEAACSQAITELIGWNDAYYDVVNGESRGHHVQYSSTRPYGEMRYGPLSAPRIVKGHKCTVKDMYVTVDPPYGLPSDPIDDWDVYENGQLVTQSYRVNDQNEINQHYYVLASDAWVGRVGVVPVCRNGGQIVLEGSGQVCVVGAPAPTQESQGCECEAGDSPVGGPPKVTIGNPIAIDSGNKLSQETDYSSADGLMTVSRSYQSRPRNPLYSDSLVEVPGFSDQWHGLLPGRIDVVGGDAELLRFLAPNGQVRRFFAGNPQPFDFVAYDQSRLKLAMIANPAMGRADFFKAVSDPNSTGELRLDYANGDYVLFRRAGTYETATQTRTLVPVERGLSNGYRQWFDYPDAGLYPNKVRDNFGRELTLIWGDTGWSHPMVRGLHKGPGQGSPPVGYVPQKAIASIGLPDGTTLHYTYGMTDPSGYLGRLEAATRKDASGAIIWSRNYLYEDTRFPAALTGIVDQAGARLSTYAYDASGRATSSERAGGVDRQQVAYSPALTDGTPDVRTVTNPLGLVSVYTYSGFRQNSDFEAPDRMPRRLLSIEVQPTANVTANSSTLNYTLEGQLESATDPKGNVSSQAIDAAQLRPDSVTDAAGNTWQIEWSPQFDLPVKQTLPGKLSVQTQYDGNGQILSRSLIDQTPGNFGAARTSTYTWAPGGRLLTLNGPRDPALHGGQDDITAFTYDAQGNRLTMTNPLGHVTSYANYDANGNPGEMTDPNGVKTVFTYDSLGRVKSVTVKHPVDPALDAITSFDYDIEGRVVGLTSPDTAKLIFDYDLAGRLLSTRSEDGERIDYTYDAMSNQLSETVRRADGTQSRGVSRTYDELGRMLSEVLGPGRETRWAYDANGNATQIISPRGTVTSNAFDALDRLVETIAPAAGTVTTDYDSQSNPSRFTDANQVATQFTRNGFGDVVQEVSPDRGTTSYTYDEAGDIKSVTDGRGVTVAYQRDILGRIVLKTPSDNAANAVRYDWDLPDTETTWRIGRLTRIKDATGWTVFNYDHRGNLTSQRQKLVGTADWVYLRYSYDLADRIRTVTYPSGRQVLYTRDDKGRVLSVKTRLNSTVASWTMLASGMTYEPFGPVKAMHLGNGLRAVNDWGDDGRLASRRLYRLSDGTNLSRLTYGYDADDNVVRITDTLDAGKTQKFVYDEAGRVSRVDVASGPVQRINYVNDNNGNRLRQVNRALPTDTAPLSTDTYSYTAGTNRLASVKTGTGAAAPIRTIQYDARGNTASETRPGGVSVTTAYDGYGRLTQYTRGTEALSFQYNGRDDRVAMTSASAGVRRYVYDPAGRVIGEYGFSAADVKAEFIWLSPEVANDNPFGGDDGIGGYAPLAVATPDLTGAVQLNWVHSNHLGVPLVTTDASGNPATTPNDYLAPGFPGQSKVLADLYYNRYRDYDPTTGRYIQADPIGLAGGGNPYLYAGGNPMGRVDPWGLEEINLFPYSEPNMRTAADAFYNSLDKRVQDAVYLVFTHGSGNTACVYTRSGCLNGKEFAKWMQNNGYDKFKPIVLYSCYTGSLDGGFAQELSTNTGVPVRAPTDLVWYNPKKGIVGVGPRLYEPRWWLPNPPRNTWVSGNWRTFYPRP